MYDFIKKNREKYYLKEFFEFYLIFQLTIEAMNETQTMNELCY